MTPTFASFAIALTLLTGDGLAKDVSTEAADPAGTPIGPAIDVSAPPAFATTGTVRSGGQAARAELDNADLNDDPGPDTAWACNSPSTGSGSAHTATAADDCARFELTGPVVDTPAPFFWDVQKHQRVGAAAYRYELDNPSPALTLSAWYWLAFVAGSDRVRLYEHNPSTSVGPRSAIGVSQNTAWHVATTLLGRATGIARPGEIPFWARARTGTANGPSAGLIFALAQLDVLTPGALGEQLRIAGTGAISSDGTVIPVRMVDAKLAAARVADVDVFFARILPPGSRASTIVDDHQGFPLLDRTIGDWLNTAGYEAAGREAANHPDALAIVQLSDIRQALAWLCGRTHGATTCNLAHTAATATISETRPYTTTATPPATPNRDGPQ